MKKYFTLIVFSLVLIRLAKTQSGDSSFWTSSLDMSIGLGTTPDNNDAEQIQVASDEQQKLLSVKLPTNIIIEQGLRVQVLDVYGVVLKDQRFNTEREMSIDVSDLPLGVYAVRIQSPKMLTEHKLNIRRSHNM